MKRFFFVTTLLLAILLVAGLALAEEKTSTTTMTLEQALAYAEANSLQLQIAKQDLENAEAKMYEAGSAYWPQFSSLFTGSNVPDSRHQNYSPLDYAVANHLGITLPSMPKYDTAFNTDLSLTQQLFNPAISYQYQLAKESYQFAEIDYDQSKTDLTFNVANAYFGICKAKEAIITSQDTLNLAQQNLKMVKANFDAGITVKTDVLKMELNVSNASQGVLTAKNAYKNTLAIFKQLINYPQDKELEIQSPNTLPSFSFTDSATPNYENRYDWRKSTIAIGMAETGVKLAKSGYLPIAFAKYDYNRTSYDKVEFDEGDSVFTVGLQWSFSLGGKTKVAIKQAGISLQKAKLGNEAVKQTAITEVLQSQLNYTEAKQRIDIVTLALKIAEENSRLAQKRYEAGVGTALEVSDAQVALERARTDELNARYDLFLSGIRYKKALGNYKEMLGQGAESK